MWGVPGLLEVLLFNYFFKLLFFFHSILFCVNSRRGFLPILSFCGILFFDLSVALVVT